MSINELMKKYLKVVNSLKEHSDKLNGYVTYMPQSRSLIDGERTLIMKYTEEVQILIEKINEYYALK